MARRKSSKAVKQPAERPIGTANQSQFVSIFGSGSIYEMRGWHRRKAVASSLMITGLDQWPNHRMNRISEPALEAILDVDELLEPPSANDDESLAGAVPAIRFPEWMSCSDCGRMGTVRKGHFYESASGVAICSANSCEGHGLPARFVVACEGGENDDGTRDGTGHISDFPWERWCHLDLSKGDSIEQVQCERPQLSLKSLKGKTGLDGLRVECRCGQSNSLKMALRTSHKHLFSCQGEMPWLRLAGVKKSNCNAPVRVLLRGASNVYFPISTSVISIPPWSNPLYQKMGQEKKLDGFLAAIKGGIEADVFVPLIKGSPWAADYTDDQIKDALVRFANWGKQQATQTFDDRLSEERHAIVMGNVCKSQDGDQFLARPVPPEDYGQLKGWIENLVQVERLREVKALSGFTRIHNNTNTSAPLSKNTNWLPAINVFGEGVYFELSQSKLSELEQRFANRLNHLKARCESEGLSDSKSSVSFVALHTLSHLLIRQLSLECGYSSASLKERIYVEPGKWAGVLIYTASSSSDGTLGGLVQQSKPETLARLIKDALQEATWCSSDPLCIESEGQGNSALNLAACHACSLIAETSCSERNSFLDRGVLIGAEGVSGYFEGF